MEPMVTSSMEPMVTSSSMMVYRSNDDDAMESPEVWKMQTENLKTGSGMLTERRAAFLVKC